MDPKTLPETGYNRTYKGPIKALAGLNCRLIGSFKRWGPYHYIIEFAGLEDQRRIVRLKHVPKAIKANKGVKEKPDE